jgi:hypothetical protein
MLRFKGVKPSSQIIKEAKASGWVVDTEEYDKGGDWIYLHDMFNRSKIVEYNVCNGHFCAYEPFCEDSPIVTHESSEFDEEEWYKELLDLFYVRE